MRMVQILKRGGYSARPVAFYTFDGDMISLIADGDGSAIPQPEIVWDLGDDEVGELHDE